MATSIPSATRVSPDDCICVEPGCGFVAPPRALLDHLVAVHSMRAVRITYGLRYQLVLPASEHRLVLLAEEDERVFLLAVGDANRHLDILAAVGAEQGWWGPSVAPASVPERALKAVSVLCLRASAAAKPQYASELSTEGEATMRAPVSSSSGSGPCDSAVECLVPAILHGALKNMHLRINIHVEEK